MSQAGRTGHVEDLAAEYLRIRIGAQVARDHVKCCPAVFCEHLIRKGDEFGRCRGPGCFAEHLDGAWPGHVDEGWSCTSLHVGVLISIEIVGHELLIRTDRHILLIVMIGGIKRYAAQSAKTVINPELRHRSFSKQLLEYLPLGCQRPLTIELCGSLHRLRIQYVLKES